MNKPVILSLGAMVSALLVFAVPSYNMAQKDTVTQRNAKTSDTITGKRWHCMTQEGPDSPNLIVLQENGIFLKLIDYSSMTDNGTRYDLQGLFDIKQDRLLARISKSSGEVYTDAYTVQHMNGGKMQLIQTINNIESTDSERTRYSCSTHASLS